MKKIGIIGVGKLGKPVGEVFAKHYPVIGYDINYVKPDNFSMVNTIEELVNSSDIIFIAVQTPHDNEYGGETPTSHLIPKDFDYSHIIKTLNEINPYLNKSKIVVLISTTLPGTVRNVLAPIITKGHFIYNPYLIAMGSVKYDLVNPEMVIIGIEDGEFSDEARQLINFYTPMMQNNTRYEVGTWDEAESIKIFYNTFISAKLSIVNMIQDVAQYNGNINVDVVTRALAKSNYRITGPSYMTAGMGDGGPCLVPDTLIYTKNSIKEIKNIMVGDEVIGSDGMFHKVKTIWKNKHSKTGDLYEGDIFNIKSKNLGNIRCTGNHNIYHVQLSKKSDIYNKETKNVNIDLKSEQISEISMKNASKIEPILDYIIYPMFIDNINTKPDYASDSYIILAGYYLSKGSLELNEKTGRLSFIFNINEKKYYNEVINILKLHNHNKISINNYENKNTVRIKQTSKELALKLFNDFSKFNYNQSIPNWILYGDLTYAKLLLKGMFNGYCSNHNIGISYSTRSKSFAYGLQFILYRLGIFSSICYKKTKINEYFDKDSYKLNIRDSSSIEKLNNIVDLGNIKFDPHDKTYEIIFSKDNNFYHNVLLTKKEYYSGDVYDLEVEDVHNYLTVGGLVSNCHPRDNIALRWLAKELDLGYDLFSAIVESREKQAKNMAKFIASFGNDVVIVGKTYKDNVSYTNGSYSLLLGYYLENMNINYIFYDLNTNDLYWPTDNKKTYLISFHAEWVDKLNFVEGSIVIDPWRKMKKNSNYEVIHYGNKKF